METLVARSFFIQSVTRTGSFPKDLSWPQRKPDYFLHSTPLASKDFKIFYSESEKPEKFCILQNTLRDHLQNTLWDHLSDLCQPQVELHL